jgi:hypothetical protein
VRGGAPGRVASEEGRAGGAQGRASVGAAALVWVGPLSAVPADARNQREVGLRQVVECQNGEREAFRLQTQLEGGPRERACMPLKNCVRGRHGAPAGATVQGSRRGLCWRGQARRKAREGA